MSDHDPKGTQAGGNGDRTAYISRLREDARRKYLLEREESRLELEKRHIDEMQDALEAGLLNVNAAERVKVTQELYNVATTARDERSKAQKVETYHMPDAYDDDQVKRFEVMKRGIQTRDEEAVRVTDYEVWEEKQIERAGKREIAEKDNAQLRQQLEGADREGAEKYSLIGEHGEQIKFKAVWGAKAALTPEEIEEEVLAKLNPKERIEYLRAKRMGEKQSLDLDRKLLPVYHYRQDLLDAIKEFKVLVVVGETGSGKTTQIPQYLYESGFCGSDDPDHPRMLGITQPRRVAAMSVATRVAEEMGCKLGAEVGYQIRFEQRCSDKTRLKYMTDGMLLREFLGQPDLKDYSCIMIDEAHERTLHTDVLFGLLKDLSRFRDDFRLIICSATLDAEKFSSYFDDAPIFKIPGRKHHVDHFYTLAPEANYIDACVVTAMQVHLGQPLDGDVLVFLPGQQEIEEVTEGLVERMKQLKIEYSEKDGSSVPELLILPCYSSLPADMQQQIFSPTPKGSRKIVLATNIAETSITIDNIVYVIDPGFVKQTNFNPRTGMESLIVVPTSKAAANQRSGRAGRVKPGKCFRLYTQWSFKHEMDATNPPEILRTDMGSVVLMLKSLGIDDLVNFDFMDAPPAQTLMNSLELLYALAAVNEEGELTRLGRRMAQLPMEPCQSKMLLGGGVMFGVVAEVLTIAAMMSVGNSIFYIPKDKKIAADHMRRTFYRPGGDHLTLLQVYIQWEEAGFARSWCFDHFVQDKSLQRARDIREQLLAMLEYVEVDMSSDVNDEIKLRKAITSGYFRNSARLNQSGSYTTIKHPHTVNVHPSSVLFMSDEDANKDDKAAQQKKAMSQKKQIVRPAYLIYNELVFTTAEYMRNVIEIDKKWLLELAPHFFKQAEIEKGEKPKRRKKKKKEGE